MYKTENSKPSLQGKLRLKRNNSDSMQETSNSNRQINFENEAQKQTIHDNNKSYHKENLKSNSDSNEEDNLADFKSPKQETVRKPILNKYDTEKTKQKTGISKTKSENLKSNSDSNEEDSLADFKSPKRETVCKPILNKYKYDTGKTKKKTGISRTKSGAVRSRKSDVNQPSIEGSLLRPQASNQNQANAKEAILCPVCLKPFKDDATCTGHMKSCAAKNNVSIKQLLEAKRLQDRQAEERKAIGLLAAPVIPEKKKAFRSKNFSTEDDPQIQLVLAMSESLYEAEKMVELEEAAFLAGIPAEYIKEMNDEERKKTLQSFGFTTNKPKTDIPTNKQRKKKLLGPMVLQTRSKEDKDRVLTERIACILTGEDALTQAQENTAKSSEHERSTIISSKLLKNIAKTDNKLWDQSRLTKSFHNFYVNELKSHFVTSTKQPPVESETCQSIEEDCEKQNAQTLNTSIVYEPMDLDVIINNNQEIERDSSIYEIPNMNELKKDNFEFEFVQNFINNWKETLNDSAASDVVIFVKNDKHIYVHQLVFHVQCPNILLDIEPLDAAVCNSSIKKKISWLDKEQISALAFLEFIYSGTISKYINIFYQKELVHQVEQLARLYKQQNLFTYIREKQLEFKLQRNSNSEQLENFNCMQEKDGIKSHKSMDDKFAQKPNDLKDGENIFLMETQVTQKNPHISVHCSDRELVAKNIVSNNLKTERLIDRRITASPDLFESEEDEANSSRVAIENNSNLENNASASNNIKEELDNAQDSDESDLNSQKTLINLSRSVSPFEDIHNAITPPLSPKVHGSNLLEENNVLNEEEIAEAVTPKCQSPERNVNVKEEMMETDDLANAVTPEYVAPTEPGDYVTPKKLVYTNIPLNDDDTTAQDHIDESIYTAVTPPRQQEEEPGQLTNENVHKIKSELTMFIEKAQRRNAKHIMDTDSETESPDIRSRRKNPFLKKDQDDSYRYLRDNRNKNHKAISLIERDLLAEEKMAQKNLENVEIDCDREVNNGLESRMNENPSNDKFQQVPSGSGSLKSHSENTKEEVSLSDDEIQDITVNETEISMYTKYKKSNKSDNSIAFYRKQLGFDGQKNCSDKSSAEESTNNPKLSETSKSTVSQGATLIKPKPRIIQDITLVSDSDEEESPLRTFLKDKSKRKINRSSPNADASNKDSKVNKAIPAFDIGNDDSNPLELIDEPLSPSKDCNVFNSSVLKVKSKNNVIDLSTDSDEGHIHEDSIIPHNQQQAQSDNSMNKLKPFAQVDLQSSIAKLKELEEAKKKSEDIDAEISKILQSSQEFTNIDENLGSNQEKVDNEDKNAEIGALSSERKVVQLSPISIVSSPELCERDEINSQSSKNNIKCNNYSQNSENSLALGENDDFDLLACDDWNVKTPPQETFWSKKSLEESSRARSTVGKLNYDEAPLERVQSGYSDALPIVKDDKTSTLVSSPILSQSRRSSGQTQQKSSKTSSKLKDNSENTRKLKVKSASTSTLTGTMAEIDRFSLQRSSSFVTPEQNIKSSYNHTDVTPPLNYSLLDTPNLQKELRKFGLKPQSRTKAKALLTHIYKETHSQPSVSQKRTSNTDTSSEEDEPPAKKQHVKGTAKKTETTNNHSSKKERRSGVCSVIAEEMDFDDPDVASVFQNPVSIKDAFFKLIKTNRELYNKVLTYEPLPLETLHSMLKQNGFKCQLNSLMDFLDEQCITFQVKANKSDRTKK